MASAQYTRRQPGITIPISIIYPWFREPLWAFAPFELCYERPWLSLPRSPRSPHRRTYSTTLRWCRCTSCESLVPSYPSMSIEFVLHHRSGFVGQSEKLPTIYACRASGPNVPISASTRVRVEFSGYSVVLPTIGGSVTTRVVAPATYFVF